MVQGKNTLSYKKKNVQESNIPSVGVKTIAFAHEFTNAGEDFLPFNSLNLPADWASSGLTNPSGASLLAAQLQLFKRNITVVSSARNTIQKSEYIVKNNGISFKNITSLENEVFEVTVGDVLVIGTSLLDMRKIRVEGELADTTTDFAFGYEVDVFDEEIVVVRDGQILHRSDNNDSSGATGNYYYLDSDNDGKASSIRFFDAAVGDEAILIFSTGGIVDSPNISTFQQIETLAGQIDAMVPVLAAAAGVSESDFQAAPNYVDLKNFGQRVVDHGNRLDALEDDQYSLLEQDTGKKWIDGRTIYRRAYEVPADITVDGSVIVSWNANLEPVGLINYSGTLWSIMALTSTSTSIAIVAYDSSDGNVKATLSNYKIGVGTKIIMEYVKP